MITMENPWVHFVETASEHECKICKEKTHFIEENHKIAICGVLCLNEYEALRSKRFSKKRKPTTCT